MFKKIVVSGAAAAALAAVVAQVLPDIKRYLKMRSM
ncbi:hypothetical protein P3T36_000805 [Kitasatospora sp. MAP12-15]|nr:hypothetical protein [Kitasatospora sp. MAP12-44]